MFRLWLRDLFPVARRTAPKSFLWGVRPQVLSLEDRVNPAPVVSITDATLVEGNAGTSLMTFTVNLDVADVGLTTVDFATADGSATTADADYVGIAGTVTIPAGSTSGNFTVTINGDTKVEADETFTATLSNVSKNASIGKAVGTGTIQNDDATTLTLTASAAATAEGGSITYTVTSSNAVQGGFSVGIAATPNAPATASDFTATVSPLGFPGTAGESKTFTVTAAADGIVEPTETFTVTLGAVTPNEAIPAGKFVAVGSPIGGTITDADTTQFTVSDVTLAENNGPMTFTVTSSKEVQGNFAVDFSTANGTAVAGTNYAATAGTLNFTGGLPAGQAKTFTVALIDDGVVTPNLTFQVNLSNPTNAAGIPAGQFDATDTATGTVVNVTAAVISVSVSPVTEGGNLSFVFTLSSLVDVPLTFQFDASDVTTTAAADYAAIVGQSVTIPANSKGVTVNVATVDDRRVEGTETFTVALSKLTGQGARPVTLDPATPSATIFDNDNAAVTLDKAAEAFPENNQTTVFNAVLTVTATGAGPVGLDRPIDLAFALSGTAKVGLAGAGVGVGNYAIVLPSLPVAAPPGVSFAPPGVTFPAATGTVFTAPISLSVFENLTDSGNLTATVTLGIASDPTGGRVTVGGANAYTLTIQNDDNPVRTYDSTVGSLAVAYRLVRNGPNVELYNGAALVAVDTYGAAAIRVNGTPGDDSLQIDYSNGNPVPAGGVTFDGKDGNDRLTATDGNFAKISSALLSPSSGTLAFTGLVASLNGVVNAVSVELETLLDPASVEEVNFALPAGGSSSRVREDGGGAGNGLAEFVPLDGSFVPTRFLVPSKLFSLDRGKASDVVEFTSAGANPSDILSSVRVGSVAAPFAAVTLSGTLVSDGVVEFNADTITLNAPLTATVGVTLGASKLATQSAAGTVTTAALQLVGVGGANFTLNAVNNAATLAANTGGNVVYRDANALTLVGVGVGGTFDLTVGGALSQTAPVAVGGLTTLTAGANPVTLTNPGNDFNAVRVANAGSLALTDANAVVLDGVNASGNFTLVTNNGAVTQTGLVAVTSGTTTVTTGSGNVTLTDPANDFNALNLPQAGTVAVRDANALTLLGATVAALDVQFGTGLLVTGNVTATAATVALRGGNLVRVNAGLTLRAATTVAISLDGSGGTVDLRGADLKAISSTIDGGASPDLFQLTGTTTPVTVNGKAPTSTPTGDRLDFDAQGKDVAATPNSFDTAGAAVTYLDIEAIRLLNPAAVTLDGTNGDDTLAIARAPGGPLTYRLNNGVPVEAAGTTRFRFNGLAGSDTLVVDFNPGDPVPAGGVTFDGGAGDDVGLCVLGAGGVATYTTTSVGAPLSGRVTVGTSVLDFVNLEATSQVDITNFTSVSVGFITADDVLTVSNGFDATAGKANPALIVSGATTPRVGLWKNANVTLSTAGTDGNDTVTVASADTKHGNINLTVLTGVGTDTVAVTGNVSVDGALRIQSQSVSVGSVSVTTQGGSVRVENAGTLTLSGSTVTAGTSFTQADGGPVALLKAVTVAARGGDLTFSGAVSGPGSLAANTAGQTLFAQSVGASVPLSKLTTDAGGRTDFRGPVVQTSQAQSYGDAVSFAQSGTAFRGTAGTIDFLDTLDPTAAGFDLVVGGPGVDVRFAKAVGSKAAVGTFLISDTRNLTADGAITAATLRQDNGTGATTLNGPVTLTNDLTVSNAKDVTLNGPVTATTFRQAAGTGTTALNGPLTISGGTSVTGATSGGAINLVTNAAVLAGAIAAPNAPIVLTLANGATQPGGQFTTTKLYLNGSGPYQLDRAGNALTDGKAELFVNVARGRVSVRDDTDLFLRFEDPSKAAIAIGGTGDDLTLTTAGNFTAEDPRAQPTAKEGGRAVSATSLVPLFTLGNGTLRVRFSVGRAGTESGSLTFVAEAKAAAVILGQDNSPANDRAFDNVSRDRFVVRPTLGAPVTVNGNLPALASGPTFAPFDTLLPQLVGISTANLVSQGEGNGTFTFLGSGFQPLVFTSIETFEGRNVEAFAVQTAPRLGSPISSAYSIRLSQSQNVAGSSVRLTSQLDGSGIIPNPFVVSPSLISPALAYSPPRISLADVDGDGRPDLIIANGAGDAPAVTIIDGRALVSGVPVDLAALGNNPENLLAQFFPFGEDFRGGLSVATGDFNGDGRLELVVGAGVGGGPRVQVFQLDGRPTALQNADGSRTVLNALNGDGREVAIAYQNVTAFRPDAFNFFAFESSQRGGVNVAVGDFNGDGTPDIVVGAGVGGGPRVRILSGKNGVGRDPKTGDFDPVISDFFAYDPNFRGGVFVDAGRYDADPSDDLVTAPGTGGGPHVKVFLGSGTRAGLVTTEAVSFMAYDFPATGLVGGDAAASAFLTGVGGVAFGASLDPAGQGGRRSILVTAPRGSEFSVTRFDSPDVATAVPTGDKKVTNYQQTLAATGSQTRSPTINVAAVGDPEELLAFNVLRDGGSAAGFSAPPSKA